MQRRRFLVAGGALAAGWAAVPGRGLDREGKGMIEVVDGGVVYRNPAPGLKAIHASMPHVGKVADGELLCFYRRGQAFGSADGNVFRSRSTDGGKTWVEEGALWDPTRDAQHYEYRAGGLATLDDGTVLSACARFERPSPDEPLYNPKTEGFRKSDIALFRSSDKGRTWSEPVLIKYPAGVIGNLSHGVHKISSRRLLVLIETWKAWDDPNPIKQKVYGLFSNDGGKTWELVTVADGSGEQIYYWDVRVLPLANGRVLAFFWTHDAKTDKDLPIHQQMPTDGGKTWTRPQSTGIEGQVCNLADAGDGRVVMVYNRRYAEKPGIMAVLSTDADGLAWDMNHQGIVWDARVGTNVGTTQPDSMLADMLTWAFGYPGVVRVRDQEYVACFWATQACVTHVRWARMRIT